MSSTSWKNHAPASVAAAMAVIASAATSAALVARACDGFAVASNVTSSLQWERPIPRSRACRGGQDHTGVFCEANRPRVDRHRVPAIFRPLRDPLLLASVRKAPVAELVDALDSKSIKYLFYS